jgi:hypothetical protein
MLRNHLSVLVLVVALVLAGSACGKTETDQPAAQASGSGSPENLGAKIGSSYVETLKQVVAVLKDKRPADEVRTMLNDLKSGTIDLMVGMGKEREAMSVADRATVDRILGNRISGVPMDLFKEYQEGQAFYKADSELFRLIADFNIITQYANFDLLKKQLPEEAQRLGIR